MLRHGSMPVSTILRKSVRFCMTGIYCKIPIISPGFIFVQKAFLLGLFPGELIFRGAYYWKEFCVSKWVGVPGEWN